MCCWALHLPPLDKLEIPPPAVKLHPHDFTIVKFKLFVSSFYFLPLQTAEPKATEECNLISIVLRVTTVPVFLWVLTISVFPLPPLLNLFFMVGSQYPFFSSSRFPVPQPSRWTPVGHNFQLTNSPRVVEYNSKYWWTDQVTFILNNDRTIS